MSECKFKKGENVCRVNEGGEQFPWLYPQIGDTGTVVDVRGKRVKVRWSKPVRHPLLQSSWFDEDELESAQ